MSMSQRSKSTKAFTFYILQEAKMIKNIIDITDLSFGGKPMG